MRTLLLLFFCMFFTLSCEEETADFLDGHTLLRIGKNKEMKNILAILNGGLQIWIVNDENPQRRASFYLASENSGSELSLMVPNGTYRIYAIGFDNAITSTATTYCGDATIGGPLVLSGGTKDVTFSMDTFLSCVRPAFNSTYNVSSQPSPLNFFACDVSSPSSVPPNSTYNCPSDLSGILSSNYIVGSTDSVRVSYVNFNSLEGGPLLPESLGVNGCFNVSGDCKDTQACAAGLTTFSDKVKFPAGQSGQSPFWVRLEFFNSSISCGGAVTRTLDFKNGLLNGANGISIIHTMLGASPVSGKLMLYALE